MSWLFSRALVEAYSAATCSDLKPSAPLSVMPTPHRFWRNDKPMDVCRLSRFGLTCAVFTGNHGEDLLTWFRVDFLARTSAQRAKEWALMEPDQGFGGKWQELSVRYSPDTCSWKTHRCLWEEDLPLSSLTLPKWGLMRNGVVYRHRISERPISVIVSGLWRTPSASVIAPKSTVTKLTGRSPNDPQVGLADQVAARGRGMWPTPVATMAKGSSPAALTRRSGADRSNDRLDHAVMAADGGQLNPDWVEWLMGWPIGWTDLKPLAMDRWQEWQQQHSRYWQINPKER